jgi:hypothetical protein
MNLKLSGIAAGVAFVFSLLIGLISGAGILALIRAFIFAAVFFGMSGGGYWIIRRFLPELFDGSGNGFAKTFAPGEAPPAGSLVDISLGDDEGRGNLPEADVEDYISAEEADHSKISVLDDFSGLDQKGNNGYTIGGDIEENPIITEDGGGSVVSASLPMASDNLPDLESLSTAFSSGGAKKRGGGTVSEFMITPDSSAGKKSAGSTGVNDLTSEFDVQDMASAIQTIIKRE